ncbi:uncharacterized protein LOC141852759 [Brevipalpus obovatus]|uniref:uncharacterized protein LOC141852759 n=1 Tax=Brevipalpus obovatus TaxID=246614 RepID=UPI003D9F0956
MEVEKYEDDVNFYRLPPSGHIDLVRVDDLVEERLNILAVFDEIKVDQTEVKTDSQGRNLEELKDRLLNAPCKFEDNFIKVFLADRSTDYKKPARERNHQSHFLLRLFFCRDPELKQWLAKVEHDLMFFLLSYLVKVKGNVTAVKKLVEDVLPFTEMKNTDSFYIQKANYKYTGFQDPNIFCADFDKALELVRNRKAYLEGGKAYVTATSTIPILCNKFREELLTMMGLLSTCLGDENDRLIPIIGRAYQRIILDRKKVMQKGKGPLDPVSLQDIEDLAKESYPPCMENIHNHLRKNHHLKYYGRLHYQLFLKEIGLSMEDCLRFFRAEFIKKIAPEKFDKEYKYGIRYNYGKEGKKADFSAYGCGKIINSDVGTQDCHGCPFKTFSKDNLKNFLSTKNLPAEAIEKIIEFSSESKNYTGACTLYFKSRHPASGLDVIKHPNQFFSASRIAIKRLSLGYLPSNQISGENEDEFTFDPSLDELMPDQEPQAKDEPMTDPQPTSQEVMEEEPFPTNIVIKQEPFFEEITPGQVQ